MVSNLEQTFVKWATVGRRSLRLRWTAKQFLLVPSTAPEVFMPPCRSLISGRRKHPHGGGLWQDNLTALLPSSATPITFPPPDDHTWTSSIWAWLLPPKCPSSSFFPEWSWSFSMAPSRVPS